MEHSPFRDLFNLLKPTTPHEIPWKVHFKAACRTGSFESFRKLLDIILDSFLGNVDGGEPKIVTEIHQRIKNHLNPYTKDTNRIIHCLSFVCYLATTEHEIVREYFWNNDIKQLILQLQGCSKEGAPGGGDWELIKKKASEVKQTVALDNARRVQGYGVGITKTHAQYMGVVYIIRYLWYESEGRIVWFNCTLNWACVSKDL